MSTEQHDRSMFIDSARVSVRGGRGGNGCVSFRREKYVDMGGPDGGNGGHGGDVFFRVDPQLKSLLDLSYKPHYFAEDGKPGQGSNKVGRSGEDLYVNVPAGTMVYKGSQFIADLKIAGETALVAAGGKGGRGNAAFKSHQNTAPMISEKGEPGEAFHLDLELKLLADVGLIGFPNAGKSTLLSRLTSARPKIAAYPFTTLNPNLGISTWHGTRMVLADIPGLIEGAHQGKGLGHDFLRHIERTRMMFHLVDIGGFSGKSAVECVQLVNEELRLYSAALIKKPMILILNKVDVAEDEKVLKALTKKYKKMKIFPISAVTGTGINALMAYATKKLAEPDEVEPAKAEPAPLRFVVETEYKVFRDNDDFVVQGVKVERLAAMTNFEQQEGLKRFQNILKKMGVERELKRQGAESGDNVRIGKIEFTYEP
jgi:GTP-binding protein